MRSEEVVAVVVHGLLCRHRSLGRRLVGGRNCLFLTCLLDGFVLLLSLFRNTGLARVWSGSRTKRRLSVVRRKEASHECSTLLYFSVQLTIAEGSPDSIVAVYCVALSSITNSTKIENSDTHSVLFLPPPIPYPNYSRQITHVCEFSNHAFYNQEHCNPRITPPYHYKPTHGNASALQVLQFGSTKSL